MKVLKARVLMYNGNFVNEFMLHNGIYSIDKPVVHWDQELTTEKFVEQKKFVSKVTGYKDHQEMYENIRKCEFVDVVMMVPDTGKVGFGSARMGGKTLSVILNELEKIDPDASRVYREAVMKALKIDEEE